MQSTIIQPDKAEKLGLMPMEARLLGAEIFPEKGDKPRYLYTGLALQVPPPSGWHEALWHGSALTAVGLAMGVVSVGNPVAMAGSVALKGYSVAEALRYVMDSRHRVGAFTDTVDLALNRQLEESFPPQCPIVSYLKPETTQQRRQFYFDVPEPEANPYGKPLWPIYSQTSRLPFAPTDRLFDPKSNHRPRLNVLYLELMLPAGSLPELAGTKHQGDLEDIFGISGPFEIGSGYDHYRSKKIYQALEQRIFAGLEQKITDSWPSRDPKAQVYAPPEMRAEFISRVREPSPNELLAALLREQEILRGK